MTVRRVGISGAAGRMGRMVARAVASEPDLQLAALFDPAASQDTTAPEGVVAGLPVSPDPAGMAGVDVVVEFTTPAVVMDNLAAWHSLGVHAVVGTSGFDEGRIAAVRDIWGEGPSQCLIVPNFSIGAVLMMHLSATAAPHFPAAEVIELHHDRKADAPSGTALATARRIGEAADQSRAVESTELIPGARGAAVEGVPVHSVRLPGLVAHQEVIFGGSGETLTIRHDTTDRGAFVPGIFLAIRAMGTLPAQVTVGLESLLGL